VRYPVCKRRCELEQRASRDCKDLTSLRARVGHQWRHLSGGDPSLVGKLGVSGAVCPFLGRYDSQMLDVHHGASIEYYS
jgi:hypothetical protein